MLGHAAQALLVRDHDLAGLQLADHLGTHCVQRTALAGEDVAVLQLAHAQGVEAVGIAGGDQLGGAHDDQAVGALQLVHGAADGGLDAGGGQTVLGDDVADDLGIRGAVEDGAVQLQLAAKSCAVGQSAVVAQGDGTLAVAHHQWLAVGADALVAGGVAHMAHGHLAVLGQGGHHGGGEHLVHQTQVPVAGDDAIFVDGDAAALLAAVLQGVQCVVDGGDHVGLAGAVIDAKDAALLVQAVIDLFHKLVLL